MPTFPEESITPYNLHGADKWEHRETLADICCVEEMYRTTDGTWILSKCSAPETPISGEYPKRTWHQLTHPARAYKWFKDHGIDVPAELSEFEPRMGSSRDRRATRMSMAQRRREL